MPRSFFHVYDGCSALDEDGTELPDIYTAQTEALRMSGELLRDIGAKFWNDTEWKLVVGDEHGRTLFVLRFLAEEGPDLETEPSRPATS